MVDGRYWPPHIKNNGSKYENVKIKKELGF